MIKAQAQFHFPVNGLYLTAELLGTTDILERDGRCIYFTFPRMEDDFGLRPNDKLKALGVGVTKKDEVKWLSREVLLLRVSVDIELPDEAREPKPEREVTNGVFERLNEAADVARSALRNYLDLVRTRGNQHWLSHSAGAPEVSWLTNVIEINSQRRLPFSYCDPITIVMMGPEVALSTEMHRELLNAAAEKDQPDTVESLLADAQYLAWSSKPPQYRESLLLAAVAAEVKIKTRLEQICPIEGKDILQFALRNPRDVSVQAASLYDKAAQAVANRSFRHENRKAYKSLERLFQVRNAVAHRAQTIEKKEVREGLNAAKAAIQWVDSLGC